MPTTALDEYWKALRDEARGSALELYRSGDFEKLERYGWPGSAFPR